jgi:hypothetical protein
MNSKNSVSISMVLAIILTFGVACGMLKSNEGTTANKTSPNAPPSNSNSAEANKDAKKGIVSADDKADFSVQAEELTKAKKEGPDAITPPSKYVGKIVEVTGRVARLYPEKEKSLEPRVMLKGGRPILEDVSCEFDEENKSEITKLKVDQMVTLKGLVPDRWLMFPSLSHCIIVEAK